jgi:hypothetical protein
MLQVEGIGKKLSQTSSTLVNQCSKIAHGKSNVWTDNLNHTRFFLWRFDPLPRHGLLLNEYNAFAERLVTEKKKNWKNRVRSTLESLDWTDANKQISDYEHVVLTGQRNILINGHKINEFLLPVVYIPFNLSYMKWTFDKTESDFRSILS